VQGRNVVAVLDRFLLSSVVVLLALALLLFRFLGGGRWRFVVGGAVLALLLSGLGLALTRGCGLTVLRCGTGAWRGGACWRSALGLKARECLLAE
jgi:membrane-bound ClpP family serine protease